MSIATFPAIQIWMITVRGAKSLSTVRCGIPAQWLWAGLRIVTDIGTGLVRGAGRGWTMRLGALRHFIMADGHMLAAGGAGARDLSMRVPFTDPHSSALWAEGISGLGSDLAAALVEESDGSRWASGNRIIPGITPATATSAM